EIYGLRSARQTASTSASSSSSPSIRRSAGSSNVSGGPSNPNNTTCPNPRCPSRLRVIDSSLANPRSLAKDGSAHSGRTGGPTRRFPGLTGSTFAPACMTPDYDPNLDPENPEVVDGWPDAGLRKEVRLFTDGLTGDSWLRRARRA